MRIVLASTSPRRKELLEGKNYKFEIISKDTNEDFDDKLSVLENVKKIGLNKAMAVYKDNKDAIVIGCDTIVVYNNKVFGKPKDAADVYKMLRELSDNTHEVISGVGIIYKDEIYNFTITSKVVFRKIEDQEIMEYINSNEPFGKAGSYAIQGIGRKFVLKYEGSLENIIGLPIFEVSKILDEIMVK